MIPPTSQFTYQWEGQTIPLEQVTEEMLQEAIHCWPAEQYLELRRQVTVAKRRAAQASVQPPTEKCQEAGIPQPAATLTVGGDPWDSWKSSKDLS